MFCRYCWLSKNFYRTLISLINPEKWCFIAHCLINTKSFSKLPRHYTSPTCCFHNFNLFRGFEYFSTFFVVRVMQITKTNPPRYTFNCILLREKLLLQRSVHRSHFDHQVLRLRPLENTLCRGQPSTLVLSDIKTDNIPLKNSLCINQFLIKFSLFILIIFSLVLLFTFT